MVAEVQSFTPQEVLNLFSALERLEEADVVQTKVGPELAQNAQITMEAVALLRVRVITGGELNQAEQQSLNEAGKLLRNILMTEMGKISLKNYPEYLLKIFAVIQTLEGLEVAHAVDRQIEETAGVTWSNIALNRVDFNDGTKIPEERLEKIRAAGVYLTSLLNNVLAALK